MQKPAKLDHFSSSVFLGTGTPCFVILVKGEPVHFAGGGFSGNLCHESLFGSMPKNLCALHLVRTSGDLLDQTVVHIHCNLSLQIILALVLFSNVEKHCLLKRADHD